MAIRYAANTGNWSALATWDGGSLPGSGDDVYANGKTVTIDQDVTVLSVRSTAGGAAVAGGSFALNAGRTLNAEIVAGTTTCVSMSVAGTSSINGAVTGGSVGSAYGVNNNNGSATINVTGNVNGGTATSGYGVYNGAGGTVNIVGNCAAFTAVGAYNAGAGTMNITGNCVGGGTTNVHGANNNSSGTINITGDCTGGSAASSHGANNNSSGVVNIYGTAIGSPTSAASYGFVNAGTGNCSVQIAKGSDFPNSGSTQPTPGSVQSAASGAYITLDAMIFGSGGAAPVSGRHFIRNAGTNYCTMRESNAGATLNLGELSADYPSVADVRSGVNFDFGNKTGTCAVPPAGSVALGVPVDATTGTAALSPTALLGADLKTRLEACATVQTVGDQLAALGT